METLQAVAGIVVIAVSVVAVATFAATAARIVAVVRLGAPDRSRLARPGRRLATAAREIVGHTRMLRWSLPGAAHWFVMIGFVLLLGTLLQGYGQVFDPTFVLPVIGHFPPYEWLVEAVAWTTGLGILALVAVRQLAAPRWRGRASRFFGSATWQAYYVEATIAAVVVCVLALRALEYAYLAGEGSQYASALHFPLTAWLGESLVGADSAALQVAITGFATAKVTVSMAWFIVLGLVPTMGVAWHRFTAPFNVFFRRHPGGRTSLGALQPIAVGGEPVDFEALEDLPEDAALGVGQPTDFTWKGLLDFTTCTECGRCQSQCPAWQTEKPLSPKLLITSLRQRVYQDAPYLLGRDDDRDGDGPGGGGDRGGAGPDRPLVGATSDGATLDPDVIWSCTTCGACVEQCPVDIEHVDHIVDLRRHQVLLESAFPAELNGLFKNLEGKQNPWGVSARQRLEWAKGLPFDVPQVGGPRPEDPEDLSRVDYLFWVGCAGAFEDRAKRTTRAVAELLHAAGVSFAVLGQDEACTGDPARRAGNEFLFQLLAAQNIETLRESGATKVVVTCAHCFNTFANEYPQLGLELEVVHHTQLLDRLVRAGRLTPVADPTANGSARAVTYHDPCYLGRHNGVYEPPRELLAASGTTLREMPRHGSTSFCCGAGGARMWLEERIGSRINADRTREAVATGAGAIAVGCPFCRVMLTDGLTSLQDSGEAAGEVEVLDVAQLLLAAVNRGSAATNGREAAGEEAPAGSDEVTTERA